MSSANAIFAGGPGVRPTLVADMGFMGNDHSWLLSGNAFTWTFPSSHVTATLTNVGGRPCMAMTSDATSTTDTGQFQAVAASIQFSSTGVNADQVYRLKGSFRMTTAAQEFRMGLAVVDTSIWASDPTDFVCLQKLTGDTSMTVKTRKNSGTAAISAAFGPTLAVDTWYDYELVISKETTTAAQGRIQVFMGESLAKGGSMSMVFNQLVNTTFPDLASTPMASFGAWRSGVASAVSSYWGHFGVQMG